MTFELERITERVRRPVAQLHLEIFRGEISPLLRDGYSRAYVGWFARDESAIAFALRVDGTLEGYVLGAPLARLPRLQRRVLGPTLLSLLTRPRVLASAGNWESARRRLRLVLGGGDPLRRQLNLPPPTMCLNSMGVAPAWRGRGLGRYLLEAFEKEARARGARSLVLTVLARNQPAQRLYRRRGWEARGVIEGGARLVFARELTDEGTD